MLVTSGSLRWSRSSKGKWPEIPGGSGVKISHGTGDFFLAPRDGIGEHVSAARVEVRTRQLMNLLLNSLVQKSKASGSNLAEFGHSVAS